MKKKKLCPSCKRKSINTVWANTGRKLLDYCTWFDTDTEVACDWRGQPYAPRHSKHTESHGGRNDSTIPKDAERTGRKMNIDKFYTRCWRGQPETALIEHARRGFWTLGIETGRYEGDEGLQRIQDLGARWEQLTS